METKILHMETKILIAIIIILGVYIIFELSTKKKSNEKDDSKDSKDSKDPKVCQEFPYTLKYLLTKTEYAFYHVLKEKCDSHNLLICPKVRMEDFLNVTDKQNLMKYRGYIKSRHIDFLLCDSKLHILAGLELDDSSHNTEKAKTTDAFKDNVFQAIGLPLYRIKTADKNTYEAQLETLLHELLHKN